MNSLLHLRHRLPLPHHHLLHRRTLVELSLITSVRDRALDHAVDKELNLLPLLHVISLIKSEPSKSLPLPLIPRHVIPLRRRPIDFIRRYPAVFLQHHHHPSSVHPHISLSPQALALDSEHESVIETETHLRESADRLSKLLMIAELNKIPIPVIDRLKWDLGLPDDYVKTLIPNFPDCFRVISDSLELVCWNNELSVSTVEKKEKSTNTGYEKGAPINFQMQFSRGFEVDKKFKKWVDEWQKLPYVSPYKNATNLSGNSDEGDKWVVGVLHELLSILYPKKTDRENLLSIGEVLGLRTRFKQALLHHPGIFYISRKIGSHMVVLRDGYKRDLLVEKHPLMDIRYKYIHLMNTVVKDEDKGKGELGDGKEKKKEISESQGEGGEKVDGEDGDSKGMSGSEVDDESEDDYDDDEDKDEDKNRAFSRTNDRGDDERRRGKTSFEARKNLKFSDEFVRNGSNRRKTANYEDEDEGRTFPRTNSRGNRGRPRENSRLESNRPSYDENHADGSTRRRTTNYEDENEGRRFSKSNSWGGGRGRARENSRYEGKVELKTALEFNRDRSNQRRTRNYDNEDEGSKFSRTNSRQSRGGRTRENQGFEGKRDSRDFAEFGRNGSNQRRTTNYKNEDKGRRFSHTNSGGDRDSSRTREKNMRFEGKRASKAYGENDSDGSNRRKTRKGKPFDDSRREAVRS